MIRRQLVAQVTAWVTLNTFGKDSLECVVVGILLNNNAPRITTVQGMVNAIGFIGTFRSRHRSRLTQVNRQINDS